MSYEDHSRIIKLVFDGEKAELKGNAEKAISNYRECIEVDPKSDVCYFKLATVYFAQGNYLSANTRIQQAIEIDQTNKWYYLLQTQCLLAMGEPGKATESFKKVVELEPENIEYQLELIESDHLSRKATAT